MCLEEVERGGRKRVREIGGMTATLHRPELDGAAGLASRPPLDRRLGGLSGVGDIGEPIPSTDPPSNRIVSSAVPWIWRTATG